MRHLIALSALLLLAACAGDPTALGITGPRAAEVAPQPAEPGAGSTQSDVKGSQYVPSMVPTTNGGRYWGYN